VYTRTGLLQYYKEKETKYLMIGSQLTDGLTGGVLHPQTEDVPSHGDRLTDGCYDSLV